MANTIWFDVTRIYNWNGPLVGFVRVEMESARCLLDGFSSQTRFCRYDRMRDVHLEVPGNVVAAHVRRLDTYAEAISSPSTSGLRWKTKQLAKRMIRLLPDRLQETTVRYLAHCRNAVDKAKGIPVRLLSRSIMLFRPLPGAIEPMLKQDDVFVTLGLDSESNIFSGINAIKKRSGVKVVAMCYDLIPTKFPHFLASDQSRIFSAFITDMARCADTVMCISQNTRSDLDEFLSVAGQSCPRLEVAVLGGDVASETGTVGDRVRSISRTPYILFISNIERRKNHDILYRAYRKLVEEGRRDLPGLVFVGRPGWGSNDLLSNIRLDRSVDGLIDMVDHVNGAELSHLYRHALFTVYPSLYEGWGLPVAESLAHGKFCIASSASSLPEVGGELVEYLDPNDPSAWAERMAYYFDNPQAIRDREAKIRSEYRVRSWSETTRKIVECALMLEG